jgi:hypothetical protein
MDELRRVESYFAVEIRFFWSRLLSCLTTMALAPWFQGSVIQIPPQFEMTP